MEGLFGGLDLRSLITGERLLMLVKAGITLVGGLVIARLVGGLAGRLLHARFGKQGAMLGRRAVFYGLFGLMLASALHQLGFQLGVLLGAAGIVTVAVGFAAQTSVSNLISGLFLVAERPFVVGDSIRIDDLSGEVLSIDMLSVKLRTFDNLFVRVPNETIIKSRVTTVTHFPIRRMDLQVGVAYKEDLNAVEEALRAVADRNHYCLEEPSPLFFVLGFGDSSVDVQFSVWAKRQDFFLIRTSVLREVKEELDRRGLEIAFPHVSLYAGSATEPFPVRVVAEGDGRPEVGTPAA